MAAIIRHGLGPGEDLCRGRPAHGPLRDEVPRQVGLLFYAGIPIFDTIANIMNLCNSEDLFEFRNDLFISNIDCF